MTVAETSNLAPRAQVVHRLAHELGFGLVGIAPAEPGERQQYVRDWLAAGKHGDMAFMAEHLEQRLDPRQLLPGASSVICVADFYQSRASAADGPPPSLPPRGGEKRPLPEVPGVGRIARYAWGDDYHRIIKKRLHDMADALRVRFPEHEFRTCVDTAPTLEREHATRAGLGWIGKHTLLIHPRYGSWMLLGVVVTTLPLQPTVLSDSPEVVHLPRHGAHAADPTPCGSCTRCIDACPTQCIQPHRVDASRCISYLTLEHRGLIDPALHAAMGAWVAGCDVCQEVCPFNHPSGAAAGGEQAEEPPMLPAYAPRPPAPAFDLLDVLSWTAEDRQRAFQRSALKRIKLDQLQRNALIAAGNHLAHHDAPTLRQRVQELAATGAPELLRQTAQQVLERLRK